PREEDDVALRLVRGRGGGERQDRTREDDRGDHEVAHPRGRVPEVPCVLGRGRSRPGPDAHLHLGQMRSCTSFLRALALAVVVAIAASCGGAPSAYTPVDLAKLRSSADGSSDGEVVGRWLLDEMVAPGGTAEHARRAR